ncbi:DNA replication protein psf2 [Coemansia sp. RSA 1813]|nr:DNA replication protein psf2 [Coemansia sp. RSA 1843]KAJ2216881.1 DNA replication protein psf2 [Coemansia sp. RSA 487]KAJ2571883.1 DNA replication protein psf2 [Coemansia sp. RSA 1813]
MAISSRQQEGFTMPELEYMAQCESIGIVPFYRMDRLELVTGTVGPFHPPRKSEVPLWLAVMLKRTNRCRIVAPSWLTYHHLYELCRKEEPPDSLFTRLPMHYIEIAHILLTHAEDDLVEPQSIRRLLQDLREIRQSKTRRGFEMLNSMQLQMDNLSAAEVNEIRPLFRHSFDMLRQLDDMAPATEAARNQQQSFLQESQSQQIGQFDDSQLFSEMGDFA